MFEMKDEQTQFREGMSKSFHTVGRIQLTLILSGPDFTSKTM